MDEQEKEGLSLADIIRIILTQKLLALILVVAITLVGTLGIYFIYTRENRMYSITFNLMEPYNSVVTSYSINYPDGGVFFLSEYASYSTLVAVIDADDEFSYLDADKMYDDDAVVYSEEIDTDNEVKNITVSVKSKYFSSKSDAYKFLTALAAYPMDTMLSVTVNYNRYLTETIYEAANTYSEQISYLDSQLTYMINSLSGLGDYMTSDGQLVGDFSADLENLSKAFDFDALLAEAEANHYVKNYEIEIVKYVNNLVSLDKQIADAEKNLDYYVTQMGLNYADTGYGGDVGSTLSSLKSTLTKLERQRADILADIVAYYPDFQVSEERNEYGEYSYSLTGEASTAQLTKEADFALKLEEIYQSFVSEDGYIDQFTELITYLKVTNSGVTLVGNIVLDGGMGIALTIVVSLLIGLVVACIVCYIVGSGKLAKKAKEDGSGVPFVPVIADAQAEAAPAEDGGEKEKDE